MIVTTIILISMAANMVLLYLAIRFYRDTRRRRVIFFGYSAAADTTGASMNHSMSTSAKPTVGTDSNVNLGKPALIDPKVNFREMVPFPPNLLSGRLLARCPYCQGEGLHNKKRCTYCDGTGLVLRNKYSC